jgi:hypothetical protein
MDGSITTGVIPKDGTGFPRDVDVPVREKT